MCTTSRSPARRRITGTTCDAAPAHDFYNVVPAHPGIHRAASFQSPRPARFSAYARSSGVHGWVPAGAGTTTRAAPRGGSVTPGARVAAAIDILETIEVGERPADDIAAD